MALLFVVGSVAAQPVQPAATPAAPQMAPAGEVPQIIAFDNDHFEGDHTPIFTDISKLGTWNNSISSMVILSGTWQFFDDTDMKGTAMKQLGPGLYPNVKDVGIKDNSISSIRLVSPREHLSKRPEGR